jgi:exonuclease VII large subunit
MKADLKTKTEKLIQRIDRENQKLDKQVTRRLDSEISNVVHMVSQVQREVGAELVAAEKRIDTVKGDLERKLVQQTSHFNNVMEELATRIVDTRTEADVDVK